MVWLDSLLLYILSSAITHDDITKKRNFIAFTEVAIDPGLIPRTSCLHLVWA